MRTLPRPSPHGRSVALTRTACVVLLIGLLASLSASPVLANPGTVREFVLPTPHSGPSGIDTSPDGSVWFTEAATNRVGHLSAASGIAEFAIPTPSSSPAGIALGPDGSVWFAETEGDRIGRVASDLTTPLVEHAVFLPHHFW